MKKHLAFIVLILLEMALGARFVPAGTYYFGVISGGTAGPTTLAQWGGGTAAFLNNGNPATFGYGLQTLKTPTTASLSLAVGIGPAFDTCHGTVTLAAGSGTATNACILPSSAGFNAWSYCIDTTDPHNIPTCAAPGTGTMSITGTASDVIEWHVYYGDGHYYGSGGTSGACVTTGKCFSSAHGGFNSLSAGARITIELLGPTITCGSPCTTGVVKPFETSIASIQSDNLVTLTAAPTVTAATTGLAWVAGADNESALNTAISGSTSVKIPCASAPCVYYELTQLPIATSNLTIQCQSGATFFQEIPLNDGGAHNEMWRINSAGNVNNLSIQGCTFISSDWREVQNHNNPPGYETTNNGFDFAIGSGWLGALTNLDLGYNTFRWQWSQAMFEAFGFGTHAGSQFFVHDNNWDDCANYGFILDGGDYVTFIGNRAYNCRSGSELDQTNGQSTQHTTWMNNLLIVTTNNGADAAQGGQGFSYTLTPDAIVWTGWNGTSGTRGSTTGTTVNGSPAVAYSSGTVWSLSDINRSISGTNIPASTTIIGISADGNTAFMNKNATGSGTNAFNFGNYNYNTDYASNNVCIGPGRIQSLQTCGTNSANYVNNQLGTNSFGLCTQNCGS